jgi:hypothetical protein
MSRRAWRDRTPKTEKSKNSGGGYPAPPALIARNSSSSAYQDEAGQPGVSVAGGASRYGPKTSRLPGGRPPSAPYPNARCPHCGCEFHVREVQSLNDAFRTEFCPACGQRCLPGLLINEYDRQHRSQRGW